MKKLILLCFLFVFSNTFYAQTTKSKSEPTSKETTKKKSSYNYDKDVPVKSTKKRQIRKRNQQKKRQKKKPIQKSNQLKKLLKNRVMIMTKMFL